MSVALYGFNLKHLRELAKDVTAPTETRVNAMKLIREFETEFAITFGVKAKIE